MENTNKKEQYYIFLDVDGTLWDNTWASQFYGPFTPYINPETFIGPLKSESVQALNFLISSIEKHHNVSLIITSKRRQNMPRCIEFLHNQGLTYDKPIFCTKYSSGPRGQKIIDYMTEQGETALSYQNKGFIERVLFNFANNDFKNYVVLDDNVSPLKKFIPESRMLLTNKEKQALTMKAVEKYLAKNHMLPESTIEIEKQ